MNPFPGLQSTGGNFQSDSTTWHWSNGMGILEISDTLDIWKLTMLPNFDTSQSAELLDSEEQPRQPIIRRFSPGQGILHLGYVWRQFGLLCVHSFLHVLMVVHREFGVALVRND